MFSCRKDSLEYQNDFDKSYSTFLKFKNETKNNYKYKISIHSFYDGIGREYTLQIEKGIVTKRSFIFTEIGRIKRPETGWTIESAKLAFKHIDYKQEIIDLLIHNLEWTESREELGTKESYDNIWTLDQVYEKANNEWIIKRPNASVFFDTQNNGMISIAGYVTNGCQDDCFTGIKITKIERL